MSAIIQVKNISKKYEQNGLTFYALDDVSLCVEKQDLFGVIGLSGAGKSTLIRALARLVIPSSGQILFHGKDIIPMKGEELRQFRKKIGMVFQHFNLLQSRTVAENISYPLEIAMVKPEERDKRVNDLLELVGLKHKRECYPSQLSGGEKQRVGIARALANSPELLLCDEATSALDPKTTREILSLLKHLNQTLGLTIVLITHEMEVIKEICNKVAVIEKGKLVEQGPLFELFAHPQHATTKHFLQNEAHEIPLELLAPPSPNRKVLKLKFKGRVTEQPVISQVVRSFHVDINILLGWIDRLQGVSLGTLVVEILGEPVAIEAALDYFKSKAIDCEEVVHES